MFVKSNTELLIPALLDIKRKDYHKKYCGHPKAMTPDLNLSTLMLRGWVLHEQMLSPRSVYIGEKLAWECTDRLATEIFPGDVPVHEQISWGSTHPLRLARMLKSNLSALHEEN